MTTHAPLVAIVGRPNVGKSTLFNRLVGGRPALVHDTPGLTRDRRYGEVDYFGSALRVVDTGGLDPEAERDVIGAGIHRQALHAVGEAEALVLVVDGRAGVSSIDHDLATRLRATGKPVFLVVNKIDHAIREDLVHDFHELGLGAPHAVSAAHGRGIDAMLETIVKALAPRHGAGVGQGDDADATAETGGDELMTALDTHAQHLDDDTIAEDGAEPAGRAVDPALSQDDLLDERDGEVRTVTDRAALSALDAHDGDTVEGDGDDYHYPDDEPESEPEPEPEPDPGDATVADRDPADRRSPRTGRAGRAAAARAVERDTTRAERELERERNRGPLRVAFVGRPNAGKSSLTNRLLGEERSLVHHEAGTTTDPVDSLFTIGKREYLLVDTAGIRRKAKVDADIERIAVSMALSQIERADIVVLVIDASIGPAEQDARIAGMVDQAGRGLVIAYNKSDLITGEAARTALKQQSEDNFHFLSWAPFVNLSAQRGDGVDRLLDVVDKVSKEHAKRVQTSQLNRFFAEVIEAMPPPLHAGRAIRIHYITQAAARPPTFILWANNVDGLSPSYRRFLANRLRERYGFRGTPIRIILKARKDRHDA